MGALSHVLTPFIIIFKIERVNHLAWCPTVAARLPSSVLFLSIAALVAMADCTAVADGQPAAVLWLHGLGDSGRGWSFLQEKLAPHFEYVKWEMPDAPVKRIEHFGGHESEYMPPYVPSQMNRLQRDAVSWVGARLEPSVRLRV